MLTVQNLFRLLGILTMGSIYLQSVFFRLPFPFNTPTFYLLVWVLAVLLTKPRLFLSKYFYPIYYFVIIYFLGFQSIWNELASTYDNSAIDFSFVRNEISWLFLSTIIYIYFIKVKDYRGIAWVILMAILFILITSLTSIIGLNLFPSAARIMATPAAGEFSIIFKLMGIGTYGFYTGALFLLPIIIYYIKNNNSTKLIKLILLLFVILIFYAIIKAQVSTITIFAGFAILFAMMGSRKIIKTTFVISTLFIIIFIFFQQQFADLFYGLSNLFTNSRITASRFTDIGDMLTTSDFNVEKGQTYVTSVRLKLSFISLESFISNPIWGSGIIGGHAFWLDRLGLFGLLGSFPWIIHFRNQIYLNSKLFNEDIWTYYIISFSIFVFYGLIKSGMGNPQVIVSMFFIVPGMYFLKYLKSNRSQ